MYRVGETMVVAEDVVVDVASSHVESHLDEQSMLVNAELDRTDGAI